MNKKELVQQKYHESMSAKNMSDVKQVYVRKNKNYSRNVPP